MNEERVLIINECILLYFNVIKIKNRLTIASILLRRIKKLNPNAIIKTENTNITLTKVESISKNITT